MIDLESLLESCAVCPRVCGVNRLKGELGFCKTGKNPKISAYNVHKGEEPPISGFNGSGTIFFTGCNLKCVFCQNYPISQLHHGNEITIEKLSKIMLDLQNLNVHNINLVTPTHVAPQIIRALFYARKNGLKIPIVYNSGGYESKETLKLLEGIIDIYMPDIKYSDDKMAEKYSSVSNYWGMAAESVKEMYRQVGGLKMKNGIAVKGVLIRHLVLPCNIAGSKKVLKFIAEEISKDTYVSIMSQYHIANKAEEYPELRRKITRKEYSAVLDYADKLGIVNGWRQEMS